MCVCVFFGSDFPDRPCDQAQGELRGKRVSFKTSRPEEAMPILDFDCLAVARSRSPTSRARSSWPCVCVVRKTHTRSSQVHVCVPYSHSTLLSARHHPLTILISARTSIVHSGKAARGLDVYLYIITSSPSLEASFNRTSCSSTTITNNDISPVLARPATRQLQHVDRLIILNLT